MTNGQYPPPYPPYYGQPGNPGQPVQPQPGQQPGQQPAGYPSPQPPWAQPQQPPQQPAGYPMPPGPAGMPAGMPAQPGPVPRYNMPDEAALLDAYRQHSQEASTWGQFGDRPQFVKFAGPQGQLKWDRTVPIGYETSLYVYILPPWAPGKNIFRTVRSHFWKSYANPNGTSLGCPGSDQCLICQAKDAAMSYPDLQLQERAKQFGRVRTQHLYNVVILDNPNGHFGKDGMMRPFILGAGAYLHKAIGDIIEDKKGALNVVDPLRGRPIRIKRRKTGPNDMDIEYAAIAQDPAPLPPHFYPCLQNVHNLDEQERLPKFEDMLKAVQEMGLPMPPAAGMGAPAPSGWQPQPPPPNANPYPYSYQGSGVGQPNAPAYVPPPDPMEFPPGGMAQPGGQPGYPGGQPWPGAAPTPPTVQVPAWNQPPQQETPPPVHSNPQETPYLPQPGQGVPVAPPVGQPGFSPAPVQQPGGQIPPAPAVSAPPGVQQPQQPMRQPVQQPAVAAPAPASRPPCFGRHNPQDRMCQGCPDQLKGECVAQAAQPQGNQQSLQQLQSQLAGGQ